MRRWHRWWIACAALLVTCGAVATHATLRDLEAPHDQTRSRYVGSDACRSCHPQHHASWHGTFHRTMTQEASSASVLGDFNNARIDYGGVATLLKREGDDYLMRFSKNAGAQRWQARVERTVGSHRVQQYLARAGDTYLRLPIAWDIEAKQWIHMNGAFLTPDPIAIHEGTIDRADFDRHVTRWNDNCVFCHNVAPNPGLRGDGSFSTRVAELGVACEACHGPAGDHVSANRNPLRRYALHLSALIDPSVANPSHMPSARSAQVCGRCHGQRKADHIDVVLARGDAFVPGTDLSAHSEPLMRDTTLNGVDGTFAPRFWNDGTPRLTAYEYQGLLLSPCSKDAAFDCGSCHSMHDSDANMQLRRDLDARTRCTQCHTELSSDAAIEEHSHHAIDANVTCASCHMPKVVYGVIDARISHRIESPDPAQNKIDRRPDACTLCHVMQTRQWAADAIANWNGTSAFVASDADDLQHDIAEVERALFEGDPIERALAAAALGHGGVSRDVAQHRSALLLDSLVLDRYPAVRHIARDALLALHADKRAAIRAFDITEVVRERRLAQGAQLARTLGVAIDDQARDKHVDELRVAASARDIEIGE